MRRGHDAFRSAWPRLARLVAGLAMVAWLPLDTAMAAVSRKNDRFQGTAGVSSPQDDLEIHFYNPSLANKTVKIIVFDEGNNELTVQIQLDKDGRGKRTIPTPDWNVVILSHPTSDAHGVVIRP